jgi:hypothetical protein
MKIMKRVDVEDLRLLIYCEKVDGEISTPRIHFLFLCRWCSLTSRVV